MRQVYVSMISLAFFYLALFALSADSVSASHEVLLDEPSVDPTSLPSSPSAVPTTPPFIAMAPTVYLEGFDTVVSFGDSYSDVVGQNTNGGPPGYFNTKVATAFGASLFIVKAISGAVTDRRYNVLTTYGPELQTYKSVANFIWNFTSDPRASDVFASNTLYLLWSGINDLQYGYQPYYTSEQYIQKIMGFVLNNVNMIDAMHTGPGYKEIILFNLPPFEQFDKILPGGWVLGDDILFNSALEALLPADGDAYVTSLGTRVRIVDVFSLVSGFYATPPTEVFTGIANGICYHAWNNVCPDPDNYVFYVTIHLTARVHTLIANLVLNFYPNFTPKTAIPSNKPTAVPSTSSPTAPTAAPSRPTIAPSARPTSKPSRPTQKPTSKPTAIPSSPTIAPSANPSTTSPNPSLAPSALPSVTPSGSQNSPSTSAPSESPSQLPTSLPSSTTPSASPTVKPSTAAPTSNPSLNPTKTPTSSPTATPTAFPSQSPSSVPTTQPSAKPTVYPSTKPSVVPTASPTADPFSSSTPTTISPTTTSAPSESPSQLPSSLPSSASPTVNPSTAAPTANPSLNPTKTPTSSPTATPTALSQSPSLVPTAQPSSSPSQMPTSAIPTSLPSSAAPSSLPTLDPLSSSPTLTVGMPTSLPPFGAVISFGDDFKHYSFSPNYNYAYYLSTAPAIVPFIPFTKSGASSVNLADEVKAFKATVSAAMTSALQSNPVFCYWVGDNDILKMNGRNSAAILANLTSAINAVDVVSALPHHHLIINLLPYDLMPSSVANGLAAAAEDYNAALYEVYGGGKLTAAGFKVTVFNANKFVRNIIAGKSPYKFANYVDAGLNRWNWAQYLWYTNTTVNYMAYQYMAAEIVTPGVSSQAREESGLRMSSGSGGLGGMSGEAAIGLAVGLAVVVSMAMYALWRRRSGAKQVDKSSDYSVRSPP